MANIKGLRSCVTVKDYSVLKKNTNKAKAEKEKLRKTRKAEIEREKQIKAFKTANALKVKKNELSFDFMERCVKEDNIELLADFYKKTVMLSAKEVKEWFSENFSSRVIVAEKTLSNAEKALKALEMLEANEKKSDVKRGYGSLKEVI